MTVSMRVMSAGKGYQYLLRSVVAGDGNRHLSTPLTRYYTEAGTPPGRWLGSGLHALGHGEIRQGDPVSEPQLALLLGTGRDPVTGGPLGRAFPEYDVKASDYGSDVEHSARRAVAGYDLTFSVPKSVSALWGVADEGTQAVIVEAHHSAVAEVIDLVEREVAATRRGVSAGNGAVAQADVVGIVATAFDHWDSRLADPQLHTHVVVSNKVRTAEDGRWRSLDGRPLHSSVVALSEHYNAELADRITSALGIEWEARSRGDDRSTSWELAPVTDELIHEFSSRSRGIELEKERLIEAYVAERGRHPSAATVIRLRAQATLTTRPAKTIRSLADLSQEWRRRAGRILGSDAREWARRIAQGAGLRRTPAGRLRADDIPLDIVEEVAASVVCAVSQKRSTWRHWNLWAEASRQTMGWRFASTEDREGAVGLIVAAAKARSVKLTPPDLASVPQIFQRTDGTSRFRPQHSEVFTSAALLEAEDRLLARSELMGAPVIGRDDIDRVGSKPLGQRRLRGAQLDAIGMVGSSGRHIDVLVGPAGAGKTTAMHALKQAWDARHGDGSVVGLAPSAAAAQVLAEDLGIACENTTKWLHEYDRGRAELTAGQLVIIDEATLAGTLTLDRIAGIAAHAGAKLLLVGDWAQLQSVDAGGAFSLLAGARESVAELTDVHRFEHDWERNASLDLRLGRREAIDVYNANKRLRDGSTEEMIDAAYAAWRADIRSGLSSLLVTDSTRSVFELNARARAERVLGGDTRAGTEVRLADGSHASEGDLVITRRNDRRLKSLRGGWVRNGDRWRVLSVGKDGSAEVRKVPDTGHGTVRLPAPYVAEHLDLGYAVTAHRAQGVTVDSAHVLASAATTRENLYVAMTRGRKANIAYVALDRPDDPHATPEPGEVTAQAVLYGVLKHSGAELSAHEMLRAEQDQWSSIAQLVAEYETIAAAAQRDRWVGLLGRSGLTQEQVDDIIQSDSFGPLSAELRRAEANHHHLETLLQEAVDSRGFTDAADVGAVLLSRVRHLCVQARRGRATPTSNLVARLIQVADGPMSPEMSAALSERASLIERRAFSLAHIAIERNEPWLVRMGRAPEDEEALSRWTEEVAVVAVYRNRYNIVDSMLGDDARSDAQRFDRGLAQAAIRFAREVAGAAPEGAECGGTLGANPTRLLPQTLLGGRSPLRGGQML